MGWYGSTRDSLEQAKKNIEGSVQHSLDWLNACHYWNETVRQIDEANEPDFEDQLKNLPHNCEFYDEPDNYEIDIPNFDGSQILKLAEFVTEDEAAPV